jgi:hypothetical protein
MFPVARPGATARLPGTPQAEWEVAARQGSRAVLAQARAVREVGKTAVPTRLPTGTPPPPTFPRTLMLRPSWMPRLRSGQPSLSQTARLRPLEVGRKATGIIAQAKTACGRVATQVDRRMVALHFCSAERCVGLEAWRPTHPSRSLWRRSPNFTLHAAPATTTSGLSRRTQVRSTGTQRPRAFAARMAKLQCCPFRRPAATVATVKLC